MRVLLYDHNRQRNRSLHQHLEDANIQVASAECLKDFLMKIEKPALKVLLIEQSRIEHYNINIEELLNQLGLTFIVIVYTETERNFDFTLHYLQSYFAFPFITEKDKKLIKKVKKALKSFKEKRLKTEAFPVVNTHNINEKDVIRVMDQFTEKQKLLITKLLEKKDGVTVQEIIQLLDANEAKNSQNYAQTHIYRLRNKLNRLLGKEYIISYKDHSYQLLCIPH